MASIDVALRLGNSNMKTDESKASVAAKNDSDNYPIMDENFEYRGYHKFGRILGKGSFGTVIECMRKSDSRPIALKLVKTKAIYKWVPESSLQKINDIDTDKKSDRLIPIEVACLLRSIKINGVVKLNEYWSSIDKIQCDGLKKNENDS